MRTRVLYALCGVAALGGLGGGLTRTVYFERTPQAVRDEQTGHLLILVAGAALMVVALAARPRSPGWVPPAVATPAVLCGGLTWLAGGTLLPQLVALPAFAVGLAGLVGLVRGRRP